jgi:iron complex transport system ATP-binding protein
MYEASNISLGAKDKAILHDVTVSVAPGVFTAVVGPNGAGKSTLLKVLSCEHSHYQGQVQVNGRDVRSYSPQRSPSVCFYG